MSIDSEFDRKARLFFVVVEYAGGRAIITLTESVLEMEETVFDVSIFNPPKVDIGIVIAFFEAPCTLGCNVMFASDDDADGASVDNIEQSFVFVIKKPDLSAIAFFQRDALLL